MTRKLTVAILVVITTLILVTTAGVAQPAAPQTTTFFSVGDADAALLSDGAGYEVLIDGGKPDAGPSLVDYLRAHSILDLETVVATHPDNDHIGGLIAVFQADDIQVSQVLYNGYPGETQTWQTFVNAVAADGLSLTTVQFPSVLNWGSMTSHILNPSSGLIGISTNDASLVIRVDYGTTNTLFTGDISSTIEATVVARGTPVGSDILKVPHHGSVYSSSSTFLNAVQPEWSIVSAADDGDHPAPETITRLQEAATSILVTKQTGNITVISDGLGYSISCQNSSQVYLPWIVMTTGTN